MASNTENTIKNTRSTHGSKSVTGATNPYIRARKHRFYFIMGVFLFFVGIFGFQIVHAKVTLGNVNQQIATTNSKLKDVKESNSDLKNRVKQMNNTEYLQKLVRSKYLYSRNGETVYNLPSDRTEFNN